MILISMPINLNTNADNNNVVGKESKVIMTALAFIKNKIIIIATITIASKNALLTFQSHLLIKSACLNNELCIVTHVGISNAPIVVCICSVSSSVFAFATLEIRTITQAFPSIIASPLLWALLHSVIFAISCNNTFDQSFPCQITTNHKILLSPSNACKVTGYSVFGCNTTPQPAGVVIDANADSTSSSSIQR